MLMWRLLGVSLQNIHSGDRCRLRHFHIVGSADDGGCGGGCGGGGVFHFGLLAFEFVYCLVFQIT
jgi:hypothetical protein